MSNHFKNLASLKVPIKMLKNLGAYERNTMSVPILCVLYCCEMRKNSSDTFKIILIVS